MITLRRRERLGLWSCFSLRSASFPRKTSATFCLGLGLRFAKLLFKPLKRRIQLERYTAFALKLIDNLFEIKYTV
jgi:hypothetical protein